ncbi:MAG: ABC transporter ATP-binding protein [Candidatus Poseidoniales archaeon]|nr:MAG: ABC transporter ATP-binding protein [Candidatus Poseidoniales archaeon]
MARAATMEERGPLRRLMGHVAHRAATIRLAVLCSILNKIWDLAPPLLIGVAVDVVVTQEDSLLASFGVVDPWHQLLLLAAVTVAIWALESIFEYWYGVLWRNLAQSVQHDVRMATFERVLGHAPSWFDERRKGDLLAVLNDDVNQLERFLDKGANDLLQVGTTVIVVGAIFFAITWEVALLAFMPVPLILWGSFRYQRALEPKYLSVRDAAGDLNALLENDIGGMATIQSFTAESLEATRLTELSEAYRARNREAIRLSAGFVPLIRMAILVGFTGTLLLGGWFTLEGTLEVGAYSVLVFMTQRLLWPLTRLGETFDLYQRAMASTARILDLIEAPDSLVDGEVDPPMEEAVASSLRLENVTFAHPGRETVLDGVDVEIGAQTTVGIVGSTGSGKTTLIRLLMRFIDPTEGAVTWCGHDLRSWSTESLRSKMALVDQHVTLFPTSVMENIRYGRPGASDDDVEAAAKAAEADAFIRSFPDGYATMVGEGGHRLSGGQRQRLALARAVLKDAPVLILDEATSAVDNETEAAIQRSLRRVAEGRTTVIIAHRLSTVRHADRILVLDGGAVAEAGSHEELLAEEGLYHRLWSVQTGLR